MTNVWKSGLTMMAVVFSIHLTAHAESFTGYVVESLNGASGTSGVYDSSLVGFSTTATGPVSLYRFTSDRSYAEILAMARVHKQALSIQYVGGTITGVYIRR